MNKRFKEFLIENDAFEAYEKNLQLLELTCLPKDFIGAAFIWSKTPEGNAYWFKLNNLWEAQCT
jgi:hypothetical protein